MTEVKSEIIRVEPESHRNGVLITRGRDNRNLSAGSPSKGHVRHSKKAAICMPGGEVLPDTTVLVHVPQLPVSRTVKKINFYCLRHQAVVICYGSLNRLKNMPGLIERKLKWLY